MGNLDYATREWKALTGPCPVAEPAFEIPPCRWVALRPRGGRSVGGRSLGGLLVGGLLVGGAPVEGTGQRVQPGSTSESRPVVTQ